MRKSFQYRIYPNKKQEVALEKTLTTCRYTYNNALAERKRNADINRLKQQFDVFPWGYPELINYYDQVKTQKTEFQEELHSQVYQNTLKRVDRSFQNFSIKDDKLTLSKIGSIKIILHKTKTGIDVGLTSLITFSNGQQIEPPKYLRVSEKRLAREQIHLSKKKKRSMNRKLHTFRSESFTKLVCSSLCEEYSG